MNPWGKIRSLGPAALLTAGLALQPAGAQQEFDDFLPTFGAGSAAFVPYYTINEDWRTLVNITNTSGNSLAVKFRLHEARNSRDVLDFVVLLSPFDVWTAWIEEGEDGRPFLQTTDNSCTVPLAVRDNGANASELAYSNSFRDHVETDGDISRMSEGYIEILVMGETAGEGRAPGEPGDGPGTALGEDFRGDTAWFAKHVAGEPRNCDIIQNDFVRRTGTWGGGSNNDIPGQDAGAVPTGSGSPLARLNSLRSAGTPVAGAEEEGVSVVGYGPLLNPTPIKVNASLVNRADGIAAGIESLHVPGWGFEENLVTAQQFPWFLEPSLASSRGLWTTEGLFDLFFLVFFGGGGGLPAAQVVNEWTNNPATGALSDWVVTFPTKRFQTDEDAANIQAACSVWRNLDSGGGLVSGSPGDEYEDWPETGHVPRQLDDTISICPPLGFPAVFQERNDGRADLVVQYDIFDREENRLTFEVDGPTVSPAPPPEITIDNLPYEVNVLKIGRDAAELPSALDSLIALAIDTSGLESNADSGWLRMTFQVEDFFLAGELSQSNAEPSFGYLTTGFIFKQRDFGDPSRNFGQASEHGYGTGLFFLR